MASRARSHGMAPMPQAIVYQHHATSRTPTKSQEFSADARRSTPAYSCGRDHWYLAGAGKSDVMAKN